VVAVAEAARLASDAEDAEILVVESVAAYLSEFAGSAYRSGS
jgi:hypothetical protein